MRIYFVGSHATGKTTLCRHVSRRYGLPMISEVARAVLAEMETCLDVLRTDMDLVAEYQERVFARQIAVLGHDRAVDEPDHHVRATAGALHQRTQPHQVQRIHSVSQDLPEPGLRAVPD